MRFAARLPSLLLLLLLLQQLCTISTISTGRLNAEPETGEKLGPPDVHAALRELVASLAQMKMEITSLQKQNQEQAAKLERQKTEIDELKQKQGGQVAFSASLLADGNETLGPFPTHTQLIFKNVVTNIGSAYNPDTGAFAAPLRGVYHFEWHVGGFEHATAAVLVKNTNHIFMAYEEQKDGYGTASQGASLLLEPGDIVFVRLWKEAQVFDHQNHLTTFSGHLLFST